MQLNGVLWHIMQHQEAIGVVSWCFLFVLYEKLKNFNRCCENINRITVVVKKFNLKSFSVILANNCSFCSDRKSFKFFCQTYYIKFLHNHFSFLSG